MKTTLKIFIWIFIVLIGYFVLGLALYNSMNNKIALPFTNSRTFVCEDGMKLTVIKNGIDNYTLKFPDGQMTVYFGGEDRYGYNYYSVELKTGINGQQYRELVMTFRSLDDIIKNGVYSNPLKNAILVDGGKFDGKHNIVK